MCLLKTWAVCPSWAWECPDKSCFSLKCFRLVLPAQRRGGQLASPRLPAGSENGAETWGWRGSCCERSRQASVGGVHGARAAKEDLKSERGLICTAGELDFDKEHWNGFCRRQYDKTTFHLHMNYIWASFLLLQAWKFFLFVCELRTHPCVHSVVQEVLLLWPWAGGLRRSCLFPRTRICFNILEFHKCIYSSHDFRWALIPMPFYNVVFPPTYTSYLKLCYILRSYTAYL